MKTFVIPWLVLLGGVTSAAQPMVDPGGILNAGSYAVTGLPNSGIAQGSVFVILGKDLGPQVGQAAYTLPLGTMLGGVTVSVAVGGKTVNPFLIYASSVQITALMPSNTPLGVGVLKVSVGASVSPGAPVQVVRNAPGILTLNAAGYGPVAVQNFVSPSDQPLNTVLEAAHPGQVEVLWLTGLGPIAGSDAGLPPVANLPFQIQVLVGGKVANATYTGRSAGFPGIDQINFEVPAGVSGCQVPIAVKVEGAMSNYGTMAVAASGKVCSDWHGLSADEIRAAAQDPGTKIGSILLGQTRTTLNTPAGQYSSLAEQVAARFYRRGTSGMLRGEGARDAGIMLGSCIVHGLNAGEEIQWGPNDPAGSVQLLDAGASLHLTGPNGSAEIARGLDGAYAGAPGAPAGTEYLVPGQYSVSNGTGGADVGTFQAALSIPPPIAWTNADSITEVPRSQPLEIRWSGGDAAREYVVIVGAALDRAGQAAGSFVCAERVDAGKFTVPADVLSTLPEASSWTSGGYPAGLLSVGAMPVLSAVRFAAPGLDTGYFLYSRQQVANVSYK